MLMPGVQEHGEDLNAFIQHHVQAQEVWRHPALVWATITNLSIMVVISASVFMDLGWSLPVTRVVAVLAVLYVGLLCLGVAGDVGFR